MDTSSTYFAQSQSAAETARRLVELTSLKSAYVVPADNVDRLLWAAEPEATIGDDTFGLNLGKQAAPFVAKELANSLTLNYVRVLKNSKEKDYECIPDRRFHIGVAGGSTIYGLIDELELLSNVCTEGCVVTPLVVDPIPETIYSAGYIADMLGRKMPDGRVQRISAISSASPINGFTIEMLPEYQEARSNIASNVSQVRTIRELENELRDLWRKGSRGQDFNQRAQALRAAKLSFFNSLALATKQRLHFNWIITGIGSLTSGQLQAHLKIMYGGRASEKPPGIVGDICSRLFNEIGGEIAEETGDRFVAVTFDWLRYLSSEREHRVVAVAGGMKKYRALHTLLRIYPPDRLFNVLVTDELTARMLLRQLDSPL